MSRATVILRGARGDRGCATLCQERESAEGLMRTLWMTGWVCAVLAIACAKHDGESVGSNAGGEGSAGSADTAGGSHAAGSGGGAGHATAGQGSGGAAGHAGDTSGSSGSAAAGSGGASCPPRECVRETLCAPACGDTPFNNGCCACPEGTIDTIACPGGGGCGQGAPGCGEDGTACCDPSPCNGPNFCHGALRCCGSSCAAECDTNDDGQCTIPCAGLAPDPQVQMDCHSFTTQADCTAYQAAEFPYQCAWVVGPQPPCLAP
jgi:hypothetical protein